MWIKDKNILTPNYIVVKSEESPLHFYVSGLHSDSVENVAEAVEDFLNRGTKSKHLKKNIVLEEVLLLENGVKIGVAGTIKKIKRNISGDEEAMKNTDRIDFLKDFANKI